MDYINAAATIGGIILTGIITLSITRLSKRWDARIARDAKNAEARARAEAELIAIGPQLIKELNDRLDRQNTRIDTLNEEFDKLWTRERECRDDLAVARGEVAAMDRRYRYFVRSLLQHLVILRRMLRRADMQLPALDGLIERFREDGGEPPDDWLRTIQEDGC